MPSSSSTLDLSILPYDRNTPPLTKPNPDFLAEIGEEGMRAFLERVYLCLFESPIKELFPEEIDAMREAAEVSADFFIQVCGGDPYFSQHHNTLHETKKHPPFLITPEARLHWLACFKEGLRLIIEEKQSSDENIQSFWNYLNVFSIWLINTRH